MTSTSHFVGIVEKEPSSAFGVWFPDAPGAYAASDDFDTLFREAAIGLRLHVETMEKEGRGRPTPRGYEQVMKSEEVREAMANGASAIVVPLLLQRDRAVRVSLSIEQALLEAIDAEAEARGVTRSAFLAQAAREKIMAASA